MQGLEPRRLGNELVEYLRNAFLATRAPSLVLLAEDAVAQAEARAEALGAANLVRAMELIGQALIDMRDAPDPRTTLEVALVRLSAPDIDDSPGALLARIERLEATAAVNATSVPATAPATHLAAPPPLPGSRPALGAHLRAGAGGAPGPHADPAPVESQPAAGSGKSGAPPGPPPDPTGSSVTPPGGRASAGRLPSRDELTMAWGDKILPGLRPGVKVYMASGRFVAVDEGMALFAVSDRGLLSRAEPNLAEVEGAIAAHFGRPVPLKLVLDDGTWMRSVEGAPVDEEPTDYEIDISSLEDAPAAAATPEQRLLQAFPGAEEVQP
jgi:DNA polymerase-3 subunit gamma/tau